MSERKKPNRTKPSRPTTVAERKARIGNKGGNPAFEPTAEQRLTVELYTAFGVLQEDICLHIRKSDGTPITRQTLAKHFKIELETGQSKANAIVAGKLFQAAKDGNITAQIFWLKARAKWYETERKELTGANGAPLEPTEFVVRRSGTEGAS